MTDAPPPPVPPDLDVRHFDTMALDVKRLLSSDFLAETTGEEFKCGLTLWAVSWHQVPAGSLPNKPATLARWCGMDANAFRLLMQNAMHGFQLCSDGRFYHPVVCEMALKAAAKSAKRRAAAQARWRKDQENGQDLQREGEFSTSNANAYPNAMQGREGKGIESKLDSSLRSESNLDTCKGDFVEKPKRRRAGSTTATLPADFEPDATRRGLALNDLRMTEAEYADALADFCEWAGTKGRKVAAGASPNWQLAFANHLRQSAKRWGTVYRKEAPGGSPVKFRPDGGVKMPDVGPDWWRAIGERMRHTPLAASWASYFARAEIVSQSPLCLRADNPVAFERMKRDLAAVEAELAEIIEILPPIAREVSR